MVEAEGLSPPCHICGKYNCYTLSVVEGKENDWLVRNYWREEEGYLCLDCHQWMIDHGAWITKLLHILLKVKVKLWKK